MDIPQALEKLRVICSKQEKAPGDILTWLKRQGVDGEHHQKILTQLRAEKFVDDNRYAAAFVRDKIKFDHWGIIKIRFMLHQKGIDKSTAEKALREVDRDDYRSMIGREIEKKRKSLKGESAALWAKLARYGASRGYEMEYMRDFLGSEGGDY